MLAACQLGDDLRSQTGLITSEGATPKAGPLMKRRGEPQPSRRERAAQKLRYWYQMTPAGIQDDWSEATSRTVIPEGALERFRSEHPEVSAKGARRVVEALLQWVRVEGRSPGTHELPSYAVEEFWSSLRRDEGDWEVFCDSLGIELDAGLDELTHWVPDDDSEPMRATWSEAFDDEVPLTGYPTLFTVDGEVGIDNPMINLSDSDMSPSADTCDIHEPAKPGPGPVPGPPAWDAPHPRPGLRLPFKVHPVHSIEPRISALQWRRNRRSAFSVSRARARSKERARRVRELRQTPSDLLVECWWLVWAILGGGYFTSLAWGWSPWAGVALALLVVLLYLLPLLRVLYLLLRGRHQVQVHERSICHGCGIETLPHQMIWHQMAEKHEDAGWSTVSPILSAPHSASVTTSVRPARAALLVASLQIGLFAFLMYLYFAPWWLSPADRMTETQFFLLPPFVLLLAWAGGLLATSDMDPPPGETTGSVLVTLGHLCAASGLVFTLGTAAFFLLDASCCAIP